MTKDDKEFTKIQELAYELKVDQAMTQNVHTIEPDRKICDLRNTLRDMRISGMPVCKDKGLVGIISIDDLITCLMQGEMEGKIEDKMTRDVDVLYSDEPLVCAINKFDTRGYGRFPVLDRTTRKVVGIITKGDIIRCLLKKLEIDYHEEEIHRYRASHLFEDIASDKTSIIARYRVEAGNFKSAGAQSSNIKRSLLRLGFPPDVVRRIAIASYEAEMNMIIFTQGGEITVSVEQDRIKVNAVDMGPGIPDITQAMQPGFSTAPDWVRELGFGAGMGLPNIKKCTDEMKIHSWVGEGTNLEFMVHIGGET